MQQLKIAMYLQIYLFIAWSGLTCGHVQEKNELLNMTWEFGGALFHVKAELLPQDSIILLIPEHNNAVSVLYDFQQRKAIYKEGTSCFVEEIPPDVTYASTVEDILQHENDILNIEDEFNLQALPAPPNKQLLASQSYSDIWCQNLDKFLLRKTKYDFASETIASLKRKKRSPNVYSDDTQSWFDKRQNMLRDGERQESSQQRRKCQWNDPNCMESKMTRYQSTTTPVDGVKDDYHVRGAYRRSNRGRIMDDISSSVPFRIDGGSPVSALDPDGKPFYVIRRSSRRDWTVGKRRGPTIDAHRYASPGHQGGLEKAQGSQGHIGHDSTEGQNINYRYSSSRYDNELKPSQSYVPFNTVWNKYSSNGNERSSQAQRSRSRNVYGSKRENNAWPIYGHTPTGRPVIDSHRRSSPGSSGGLLNRNDRTVSSTRHQISRTSTSYNNRPSTQRNLYDSSYNRQLSTATDQRQTNNPRLKNNIDVSNRVQYQYNINNPDENQWSGDQDMSGVTKTSRVVRRMKIKRRNRGKMTERPTELMNNLQGMSNTGYHQDRINRNWLKSNSVGRGQRRTQEQLGDLGDIPTSGYIRKIYRWSHGHRKPTSDSYESGQEKRFSSSFIERNSQVDNSQLSEEGNPTTYATVTETAVVHETGSHTAHNETNSISEGMRSNSHPTMRYIDDEEESNIQNTIKMTIPSNMEVGNTDTNNDYPDYYAYGFDDEYYDNRDNIDTNVGNARSTSHSWRQSTMRNHDMTSNSDTSPSSGQQVQDLPSCTYGQCNNNVPGSGAIRVQDEGKWQYFVPINGQYQSTNTTKQRDLPKTSWEHKVYSPSSSCSTFSCNVVFGTNRRTKICKPLRKQCN